MIREKLKRAVKKKQKRCFELTVIFLAGILVCFGEMFVREEKNGFGSGRYTR